MAITRYTPWGSLAQVHDEINRLFNSRFMGEKADESAVETGQWLPLVDIKEEKNEFLLWVDLPGVTSEDVNLSVEDNILSIQGKRQTESAEKQKEFTRIERVTGSFYRRFSLPDTADLENISAKQKNGVLEIHIPKKEKTKARKINVETHN